MNNIKYLFTLALCFCCTLAFAQQKRISGHVWNDNDGPVIMANVVEKDKNGRIVSATTTDVNGNFSLVVKNAANDLVVSYICYTTKTVQIGAGTQFKIRLEDTSRTKEVVVTTTKKIKSNGLTIPEREISVAQQSLNMDEMQGLSFETAGEALQGQIAGLDIVANSGNLGAGTSMRLRGTSSITGSQEPLIVVDGYILENYNEGDVDYNNMDNEEQFATLLQVNPEDIQSISVLKDAAATAIWGSRGSNGVIEIKTRRGSRGKTKVNFSYRFSGSWQPEGIKMLDGDGYTMMLKEAYFNPQQSEIASGIVELMYDRNMTAYYGNYNKNTDWVDEVTQFGQNHQYGVNVSGGGEKATFRVSANYDHQTGTIIKQQLDRFSTRLALDYWVSDRIKFSSNFALTYTKNQRNYSDLLGIAYKAMPNMAIYRNEYRETADGLGEYYETGDYYIMPPAASSPGLVSNTSNRTSNYLGDMVQNGNPIAIADLAFSNQSTYTITPQFQLEYKLLGKEDDETQLNYTGEFYMNAFTQSDNSYYPHELTSLKWENGVDKVSDSQSKNLSFSTKHSLVLRPYFQNTRHSLQVLARFDLGTSNSTSQNFSATGVSAYGVTDPTVQAYLTGLGSGTGESHSMSGTASVHYAFSEKYIFDVTLRADGKTKFGSGKKWGFFHGISGRWNISDERFFKPLRKVISMLSFRPGWGITGNASFGEGLIYNNYSESGTYNGVSGIAPSNLRLTTIRWEKTKSWNLGVDLKLFNDLLQFDINVYNRKTTDLINNGVRIPSSTGFSTLGSANVGSIENEGWELYFHTRPVLKWGKFHTVFRFNIAQNLNTITDMDASVLASMNTDFDHSSGNESYLRRVQIGHALGAIYGFRFKGVYAYDYDHNGYFLDDAKNEYYTPDGQINTAKAQNKTAPIVRDAEGNVIYDKEGNPLKMMYDYGGVNYEFKGGDVIYEDINHDGQINELDIVYLGTSNPKINGGFGIDLTYGRWKLKTNFNFRIGNKIINMARMYAEDMRTNKNQSSSVNWRWRKNGQVTEIPRAMNTQAGPSYNALVSERYVEPGDFLRFQYLQ